MSVRRTVGREVRVALSKRAQPVWFRLVKWAVAIGVSLWLWRSGYFWWWIAGGITLGLCVHFVWRWKTRGWTQPWGGWNDVEAGDKE